jgi:hypothetical protein
VAFRARRFAEVRAAARALKDQPQLQGTERVVAYWA